MTPDELQDYLENLPDKVERQVADVLQDQARQLVDAQRAAARAHQAAPDETGHLEQSIRIETRDSLDVHVIAGGEGTTAEVRTSSGEQYDYALGFEFGNSRQPARPFFWNTYRAMKPNIDDAIADALGKVIDQ